MKDLIIPNTEKPTAPKSPDEVQFNWPAFICAPIFLSMPLFGMFREGEAILTFFAIWPFLYIIVHLYQLSCMPSKRDIYHKEVAAYEKEIRVYESENAAINRKNDLVKTRMKDIHYSQSVRHVYTIKEFENTARPKIEFTNMIRGKSEVAFLQILTDYFGDQIKTDKVIEIFTYGKRNSSTYMDSYDLETSQKLANAYVPDFVFEHRMSGMTIDIEIDEPYTTYGKPIHYYANQHDASRNRYFLERKWLVIRFSEEQVVLQPKSCCKEIATIVSELTGDDETANKLSDVKRLYRHPKWGRDEAIELFRTQFRSNYVLSANPICPIVWKGIWSIYSEKIEFDNDRSIRLLNPLTDKVIKTGVYITGVHYGVAFIVLKWECGADLYAVEDLEKDILLTNARTREYVVLSRQS